MIKHPLLLIGYLMVTIFGIIGFNSPNDFSLLFIKIPIRQPLVSAYLGITSLVVLWLLIDIINPHHKFYDDWVTLKAKFSLKSPGNDSTKKAVGLNFMRTFKVSHLNKHQIIVTTKCGYRDVKDEFYKEFINNHSLTDYLTDSYNRKYQFHLVPHPVHGNYIKIIGYLKRH